MSQGARDRLLRSFLRLEQELAQAIVKVLAHHFLVVYDESISEQTRVMGTERTLPLFRKQWVSHFLLLPDFGEPSIGESCIAGHLRDVHDVWWSRLKLKHAAFSPLWSVTGCTIPS